jgi:HEAT repeat protein
MTRSLAPLALALALGLISGDAHADGALVALDRIPAAQRSTLVSTIQQSRLRDPGAFATVAKLRSQLPTLDAHKRGRLAPLTPALHGLGPAGLMAMLERLAVVAEPHDGLTPTAWMAWRLGLLEAVGALRDPRSEPVLQAIVASDLREPEVARAAAAALGKLGSDSAAKTLIARTNKVGAGPPGAKQLGVLAGMGHCRRTVVAERLATVIRGSSDPQTIALVSRSLGDVGSAWAWQTPVVKQSGEESTTRRTAAAALVDAFVRHGDNRRLAKLITQAILVVDLDATPDLIAEARASAPSSLHGALDRLAKRFANSPLRRRR